MALAQWVVRDAAGATVVRTLSNGACSPSYRAPATTVNAGSQNSRQSATLPAAGLYRRWQAMQVPPRFLLHVRDQKVAAVFDGIECPHRRDQVIGPDPHPGRTCGY